MRTLKRETPCDWDEHVCPYMDQSGYVNCEWWCGAGCDEDDDHDPASADEEVYLYVD